jgi:hypothetical protein
MKGLVLRFCVIFLLLLATVPAAASPEPQPSPEPETERPPQPIYTADDCTCGQGSYEIETDRNIGTEGFLSCHYYKEQVTIDRFKNYKSTWLNHYDSHEEALRQYQEQIDDEFVEDYYTSHADERFREIAVVERTDEAFFAYKIIVYTGELGEYPGASKPPHYYLERRFVVGTAYVTIFVNGYLFSSLGEAQAELNELEACVRDLIASRPPCLDLSLSATPSLRG